MASVFLSYDREDAARARSIALALEKAGHTVWWDLHIKGGAEYGKVIEQALAEADAVVVLWSTCSVDSAWVRDEAAAGRDSGRLIPVLLEPVNPPMGFRQYQNVDLTKWKGRGRPTQFRTLIEAVNAMAGNSTGAASITETEAPAARFRLSGGVGPAIAIFIALILLAIALVLWRPWGPKAAAPIVSVAAADQGRVSRGLARDLLVKLGSLQAVRPNALQLVEAGRKLGAQSDLILEIGGSNGAKAEASLVLMNGKDRSLLWSRDFTQPAAKSADLKQQVAHTAALVLECASDALTHDGDRLDQATFKLYLNGCAELSNIMGVDPRGLLPIFRKVLERAPEFEGAWGRLLVAEAEARDSPDFGDPNLVPQLRKDIVAARLVNPHLAESYLAEESLLPKLQLLQRMQLLDEAITRNPDHPGARGARAQLNMHVGRMRDAVEDAQRAVQLDPLSPAWRDSLISALTYSGKFDAARTELAKAEKLWPGASNLLSARYRLELRYGDPHEALRILNSGAIAGVGDQMQTAFLEARIEPTPANIERTVAMANAGYRRLPEAIANLIQVLGAFDREQELMKVLFESPLQDERLAIFEVIFRPALRELHHDARFMIIAQRSGLLDYWRESGKWPDFCLEPDLPYDCKAEAAKLAA